MCSSGQNQRVTIARAMILIKPEGYGFYVFLVVHAYSGQKQRVAVDGAMILNPKVINYVSVVSILFQSVIITYRYDQL